MVVIAWGKKMFKWRLVLSLQGSHSVYAERRNTERGSSRELNSWSPEGDNERWDNMFTTNKWTYLKSYLKTHYWIYCVIFNAPWCNGLMGKVFYQLLSVMLLLNWVKNNKNVLPRVNLVGIDLIVGIQIGKVPKCVCVCVCVCVYIWTVYT